MAIPPPEAGNDPSMDDILASIRRILSDEEKAAANAKPASPPAPSALSAPPAPSDGVLMLDQSMMVPAEPSSTIPAPMLPAPMIPIPDLPAEPMPMIEPQPRPPEPTPAPTLTAFDLMPPPERPAAPSMPDPAAPLVAPEAAAATASSIGNLMRTLASERSVAVHRGGPTIEDIVREEMRPLLKEWLDQHLPPLVERLVRAEIERVVGRSP